MLSKAKVKFITSLREKKHRLLHKLFIAEGPKVISDLINAKHPLHSLYITDKESHNLSSEINDRVIGIDEKDLKKISNLKTPNVSLGIFQIKEVSAIKINGPIIALESIRDPGNLGTIIRTCDWFGIKHILCSKDSVDCYNQKVIQSTMGSISRVEIHYVNLINQLKESQNPIFIADLTGNPIAETSFPTNPIIVFGNEANGISDEMKSIASKKITIPKKGGAESLNLSSSVAIVLSGL